VELGGPALQVAAGYRHSCALVTGGGRTHLKCWGANLFGALGQGDTRDRGDEEGEMGLELPPVALGGTPVAAACGYDFTCAILEGGGLKCWGDNLYGKPGTPGGDRGKAPGEMGSDLPYVDLGPGAVVVSVATAFRHTCAVLATGDVKCFGAGLYGRLGSGAEEDVGSSADQMGAHLRPLRLGAGFFARRVTAASGHSCVLGEWGGPGGGEGAVKCFGRNLSGQLGVGDTLDRGDGPGEMGEALPALRLPGGAVAGAAAGVDHTCVVAGAGGLYCVGSNSHGQLGQGDTQDRGRHPAELGAGLPPVDLGTGGEVASVSAGFSHTCALLRSGRVKCFGRNSFGLLGVGDLLDRGGSPGSMGDALPPVLLHDSGLLAVYVLASAAALAGVCALAYGAAARAGARACQGAARAPAARVAARLPAGRRAVEAARSH